MVHLHNQSSPILHRRLCSEVIHIYKNDWHAKICEYGIVSLINIMGGNYQQGAGYIIIFIDHLIYLG